MSLRPGAIVGYLYGDRAYGAACLPAVLAADGFAVGPGELHPTDVADVETTLDELAVLAGVSRSRPSSFARADFPRVVYASRPHSHLNCTGCGQPLRAH